jgi:hypothetical protein
MDVIQITIPADASSGQSYRASFTVGPVAWLISADRLEDFLHSQKIGLKDHHALGAVVFGWRLTWPFRSVMDDRLPLDMEFKSERCLACLGPKPHGRYTDALDELCRLVHVQVALPVLADEWFKLFHHETERQNQTDFKQLIAEPDRGFQQHPCDQADGFYE